MKTSSDSNLEITLEQLANGVLSSRARFGHVALLLAALAMSIVVACLLATEPALPLRTRVAFGVLVAIGLAWAAYATWVLRTRRTLLANHRIVAGRMAVAFSALFTGGAFGLGLVTAARAAYFAAGLGLVMLTAAAVLLRRAHRRHAQLLARRRVLEEGVAGGKP